MDDQKDQIGGTAPGDASLQAPSAMVLPDGVFDPQALSDLPVTSAVTAQAAFTPINSNPKPWIKWGIMGVLALFFIGGATFALLNSKKDGSLIGGNSTSQFETTSVPLDDIHVEPIVNLTNTKTVVINGSLTIKDGLVIAPTVQPATAQPGQIYYDINSNTLAYFNGTSFVSVGGEVVTEINELTGNIPLGAGLADVGGQLVNTGVLSVQGLTGNVNFSGGNGISISGTTITNTGVVSVASSSPTLVVSNDGNGNVNLTLNGGGTGTVTSSGGTAGRLAKFTTGQNIEDSLLSESGATVTVNGNLAVTGSVTLSSPLSVANGGTGAATLGANGVLVGNGTSAITSVVSGVAGMCLVSTAGAPAWGNCNPPSSTVNSVNGLTGTLTIANATGLVDTITIDDASTSNKGIVQFNGTNFSVSNGIANTVQNISTSSSPTFGSLTLTGDIAVNGGDITSTGALNITPAGTLTAGSTTQALTLQGNSSTVFTATNGASTTTVSFQAPTANVTYRFATATAGSYDICTSAGNCGGTGTITGSGTAGTLPVFTGASAIGDSLVSQSGATVTINGHLSLTAGNQFQINGTQISSANLSNDSNLAKLNASQTFTGNNVAFQNGSNSATAFAVQNAAGNRIATVDTSGGELELGQGSTIGGRLVFNNATNNNTVTMVSAVVTGNRTITLPDDSGTVCLSSGNCAGAGATLQTSYNNSTNPEIVLDSTRGALTLRDNAVALGANLFEVQDNSGATTYFAINATGASITGTASASGNINSSGGSLQTAGTSRVDNSGNLINIGSLTLSGAISGGTTITGSGNINTSGGAIQTNGTSRIDNSGNIVNIANLTLSGAISGGTTYSGSGNINTSGGSLQTNGTTRVDNSGNLVNIAAITASGNATLQGGTVTLGTTSQAGTVVINDGSSNTGSIVTAALGQNTVYTLPDPSAGTATICLNTGNCAGVGGGVTTPGGTTGTLPVFTGAQTLGDSLVSQSGGTVTVNGNLNLTGGGVIQTAGTTRLDASGNLSNIGTLTLSGAISGGTSFSGSGNINTTGGVLQTNSTTRVDNSGNLTNIGNLSLSGSISGGTTVTGSGNFNTTGGSIQTNSTNRIANNGDLVNIGNLTASGAITIASSGTNNDVVINGADEFIIQDASVFNALVTFNADLDVSLADTENVNITNTVTSTNSVNLVAAVLTNNSSSGTQNVGFFQNAAGSGATEGLMALDNADTDTAVTSGLIITSAAGGITNALDVSDPDIVTALLFGLNDISGTNFSVTGSSGNILSAGNATLQGGTVTAGTSSQAGSLILNDGSSNTGTVQVASLGQNTVYTLPDPGVANVNICLSSGNCSGSAVTLQGAYDNSSSPEIVLDATRGAVTLRDNATPLGANLFEVQNNGGGTTYLAVTATGISVTGTATATGNINSSGGALQTNGTTRIDNSGNATNIGNIGLSGSISGGTTISGSGNINTTGGAIQTNSTSRIDNSGNLINIAAITASGSATLQGGSLTLGTSSQAGSIIINDGSSNTGTLQTAALGQNTVYTLPDPGGGTATICLTSGNCAGVGGGVTTAGGTTNRLSKFTGASSIGDSTITDNGTTVTTTVDLVIQGGDATIGVSNTQTGTINFADSGSAFLGSIVQDALGGNQTYTLPDASGDFCLSSGNCLGGAGGGANTALSNLTGVAINTTLLPGAAGTVNLGSGSLPFGDLYVAGTSGTPGTNNFRITGASTSGTRVITLPDATGTVCLQSSASCGFAPSSGSVNYIQNQIAGTQTSANFHIDGIGRADTLHAVTGINTGAGSGTQRINASGNLVNIGSISLSSSISGGTTITGSGNINTTGGTIQTNSTNRIDNSGNLVNIGSITASGNATLQGGSLTLGTTSQAGSLIISDGSSHTGTLQVASLAQNTAYTLPDPGAGTASICLTTGNCAGLGGSVGGSGTIDTLAKFTATGSTIGDSTITDDGTTVTTSVNLVVQGGDATIGVSNTQTGTLNFADGGSAFLGSITQGSLTGAQTYTLPDSSGEVCLSSGNCLGPGGSGANINLSNLSSVAINTSLLPGSAGAINLGSGTLPFGDAFLAGSSGTPGTNNFRITGASTSGTRVITLPDATGTVCLQSSASCGFAPSSGSANYIQNQIAGAQTSANFHIDGIGRADTLHAVSSLNTGAGSGTQRIDSSGNLVNIGSLTLSGAISGGTTITGSGNFNTTGGTIQTNSTNRIDNSGNLVNIGTITTSGAINSQTISSTANFTGTLTVQGANSLTLGTTGTSTGATLFKGSTAASGTITLTLATNNPSNNTISLPNETGTVCTTGSVCSGYQAAGSYANTSLSNLASVAINTALGFQSNQTANINFSGAAAAAGNLLSITGQTAGATANNGGGVTVQGGTATTTGTGGLLSLLGGSTTATGTNGGVAIDAGSGATNYNGTITIGSANASTITVGSTTLSSGTQALNIGTNNTAGSTTNVTIGSGSSATGGTTTVRARDALSLIGGTASTWDVNGTLSLQTTNNGAITTGTGLLTIQGGSTTSRTLTVNSGTTQNVATVNFSSPADTSGTNVAQGLSIVPTIGNATGGTNTANIINLGAVTGDAQVTLNAINVGALTGTAATETAINIGANWDNVLSVGGTAIINGSGIVQSAGINGSYGNLTGTGTLTSGALGAGFTTVAVGQGGTGATTFTANGILYGNTTGAIQATAAGNTGQCLVGNGAGSAPSWSTCTGLVNLQNAYNNSTNPEITVDATRGALTIRDNATPIAANLLEVQNNAGGTTYFGVTASGISVTGTAAATGNINSSGGAIQTNGTDRISNGGNLVNIGTVTTSGAINSQTISSAANFTGTVTIQGANALTVGTTGTSTGAILFKGSTAASGTITLIGQANPGTHTITLPNETGTVCTTGSVCTGYQASGSYANTALSNLASVAINTALGFQSNQTANINFNGAAATTGNLLSITGQTAGATANNGGAVTVQGGTATTTGTGGLLSLLGGNTTATGTNGGVTIDAGSGATNYNGTITIGSAFASTITVGSTTLAAGTQIVNIGTNNTAGSTTNVTIGSGSSATGGTTTVRARGALSLTGGAASTWDVNGTLSLQTTNNGAITTGTGLLTVQGGTVIGRTLTVNSGTTQNVATINYTSPIDTSGTNISQGLNITPVIGNATAGTNTANIVNIGAVSGDAQVTLNGINIGALTGTAATETAINIGANWDSVLTVGGTAIINGSGVVQSAGINGAYGNLTGTGTLTSGTLGAGFTTVAATVGGTGHSTYTVGDLLYANTTTSLARLADVAVGSCLVSGGVGVAPTWSTCSGLVTLQNAYANGNTISTSSARDIAITLADTATDSNFTITTAAGSTSSTTFSLADGANATPPSQLVLVSNLDANQALANGITVQGAFAGGVVDGLDVSDTDITNGVNIGDNVFLGTTATIDFTNFDVASGGGVTAGTYNSQTISSAASLTGTLTVANNVTLTSGDIAVNGGDITSTGALNITPTGTLTAGSTNQTLTLQGNASTTLRATDSGNTTTVGFTTPTANTTLNFPALSAGTYNICTSSGNCAGAGVTLQTAYNNSTNPELVLGSAATAGITIQDNSTPISGNLLEVQNNGGSTTFFAVSNTGVQITGTNTASGNINTTGGVIQTNSVTRIDNSGNLTNIGTVTTSGTISLGALGTTDTATYLCRNSSNLLAACNTTGTGAAFIQGGNSFGATGQLGTNDAFGLDIETSGTTRMSIGATGGVLIQGNASADELEVGDDIFNLNDSNSRINLASSANDSYLRVGESTLAFGFVGWLNSTNTMRVGTFGGQDLRLETNSAQRINISGAGVTSITGTASNGVAGFSVDTTQTSSAGGLQPGNTLNTTFNPGGTAAPSYFGNQMTVGIGAAGTTFTGDIIANLGQVNWSGASNTSNTGKLMGTVGKVVTASGSGSVQNAVALFSQLQYAVGTTVTNSYNVYSSNLQSGATTNHYGFYSEYMSGGTNNYPLYLEGATASQPILSVTGTGATTFRNSTDSATAFQIQNAGGANQIQVNNADNNSNLITNPSAEVNTTGWSQRTGATVSRNTTLSNVYYGIASIQSVNTATTGAGINYPIVLSPNTTYGIRVMLKMTVGGNVTFGYAADGSDETTWATATGYGGNAGTDWYAVEVGFTTPGTVNPGAYIFLKQNDASARTMYIDGLRAEVGTTNYMYREGQIKIGSSATQVYIGGSPSNVDTDSQATLFVQGTRYAKGLVVRATPENDLNSPHPFQVQDASGTVLLDVDQTFAGVNINGGRGFWNSNALSVNVDDSLSGNAHGLVVTGTWGFVEQTEDLFEVRSGSANGRTNRDMFSVGGAGAVTARNYYDSTAAFQVQNASAQSLFNVDTTNKSTSVSSAAAAALFSAKTDYTTADAPRDVASADFDKDGDVDLVTSNSGSDSISVFMNNGSGAYAAKVDYTTADAPVKLTAADLDKDGDVDVAVAANGATNTVSVFINNGSGVFAAKVDYTADSNPQDIIAADLDKDGDRDLVTTDLTSDEVSVFINNGSGVFAAKVDYTTGDAPDGLTFGDFDKDGDVDLAVANSNVSTVSVLMNNGSGTFAAKVDYTSGGSGVSDVVAGDFNSDGYVDLASANWTSGNVSVLTNDRDGTFTLAYSYAVGTNPENIEMGDFDKDGDIDLAASNETTNNVSLLLNNGNGTYAAKVNYATTSTPEGLTFADLDKDSDIDMAVADLGNDKVSVFLNSTLSVSPITTPTLSLYSGGVNDALQVRNADDRRLLSIDARGSLTVGDVAGSSAVNLFAAKVDYTAGAGPEHAVTADIDKDGDQDMIVSNWDTTTISVFRNNGNGAFGTSTTYTTNNNPQDVVPGDYDGDGDIDLAVSNFGSDNVSVFMNNGSGTFAAKVDYSVGTDPEGMVAGDFNKDGDLDLMVTNNATTTMSLLTNNGSGSFSVSAGPTTGTSTRFMIGTDLEKDGDIDLAVTSAGLTAVSVYLNNGSGTFAAKVDYTTGTSPTGISYGDLDEDGDVDLVVSNEDSDTISVFMNNGAGTFAAKVDYAVGDGPREVVAADFDKDGDIDVVAGNSLSDSQSLLLNNGSGTLATAVHFAGGDGVEKITTADIDKDGDLDLMVANYGGDTVSIYENTTLSNTAFKVLSGNSVPAFSVDTNNSRVQIGAAASDTTGTLLVLDTKSDIGDPTNAVNGAMYYNSAYGRFRCYQNNVWVDCISGSSREYLLAHLGSNQTTNISTNNRVQYDTNQASAGGSVSLNTGSYASGGGQFTLAAGKTYRLNAHVMAVYGAADSQTRYQWYNVTAAAQIGAGAYNNSTNRNDTTSSVDEAEAIITPAVTTVVELRIFVGAGSITNIQNSTNGTNAYIEVLSDGGAGGASAAEYFRAEGIVQTTAGEIDTGSHIRFETRQASSGSSITLDTTTTYAEGAGAASRGRFTLAAGKTYKLRATIPYVANGGTATAVLDYSWYDATNSALLGTTGALAQDPTSDQRGGYAEAIFTPSSTTLVEVRIMLNSSMTGIGFTDATRRFLPSAFIEVMSDGTKIAQFQGATSLVDGQAGYVPMPTAGQQGSLLVGDGSWSSGLSFVNTTNDRALNVTSTEDAYILLEADSDNDGGEVGTSYIRFRQDGASSTLRYLGTIQAAGFDPEGNAYEGTEDNAFFMGATGTSSSLQFGTNGVVRMTMSTDGALTFLNNSNGGFLGTSWTTQSSILGTGLTNAPVVTSNGYIYTIGGRTTPTTSTASANVNYAKINADGSVGTWSATAALPSARVLHTATVANGYIYVLGGANPIGTPLTTMYYAKIQPDGTVGTWNTTTDYPDDILEAPMVFLNGYIYVLGGFYNNGLVDDVRYARVNPDGSLGSWTLVSNGTNGLPAGRTAGAAIAVNGFIYFSGGNDNAVRQDETYYVRPNPTTGDISGAFSTATNLPVTIDQHSMVSSNGYLYAIGGRGPTSADTSQTAVYRASISSTGVPSAWTTSGTGMPALTTGRAGAGAVLVNGHIYVVGGHSGSSGGYSLTNSLERISTARVSIGGSLDLVGIQNDGNLSEPGSQGTSSGGGAITAGSGMFIGGLEVQGSTNLLGALSVGGNANFTGGLSIGSIDTTGAFLVLDTKTSSTDPTGINGAIYYNTGGTGGANSGASTFAGKMRCFEGNVWKNCIGMRDMAEARWGLISMNSLTATTLNATATLEENGVGTASNSKQGESAYVQFADSAAINSDGGVIGSTGSVFTVVEHRYRPKMVTRIRTDASSVAASTRYWVGMFESTPMGFDVPTTSAAQTVDYFGVGYRDTVNGAEWVCASGDGTNHTGIDMNVAVTANHTYDIILDLSTSGTLVCSISDNSGPFVSVSKTTNLPGTAIDLGPVAAVRSVTAVARSIFISYIYYERQ